MGIKGIVSGIAHDYGYFSPGMNRIQQDSIALNDEAIEWRTRHFLAQIHTNDYKMPYSTSADTVTVDSSVYFSVGGLTFSTDDLASRDFTILDDSTKYLRVRVADDSGKIVDIQANPIERFKDPEFYLSDDDSPSTGQDMLVLKATKEGAGTTPVVETYFNQALYKYLSEIISYYQVELWVDPVNGADTNDGSEAEPKKTIQGAVDAVSAILRHDFIIHLVDGTYSDTVSIDKVSLGGKLTILGNDTTPTDVELSGEITVSSGEVVFSSLEFSHSSGTALTISGSSSKVEISSDCLIAVSTDFTLVQESASLYIKPSEATVSGYLAKVTDAARLFLSSGLALTQNDSSATGIYMRSSWAECEDNYSQTGGQIGINALNFSYVLIKGNFSFSSSNGEFAIKSGYESNIRVDGTTTATLKSSGGTALHAYISGKIVANGAVSVSNGLYGMNISQSGILFFNAAVSINCVNNLNAIGIYGDTQASVGGLNVAFTLTGGGGGTGVTMVRDSSMIYGSVTFAGTWTSNTNITASSVYSNI